MHCPTDGPWGGMCRRKACASRLRGAGDFRVAIQVIDLGACGEREQEAGHSMIIVAPGARSVSTSVMGGPICKAGGRKSREKK